jgi:hypothetical protein
MTIYHSKVEKKTLDVNELKLDLPKIEPQFTEERTNVLGDTLMTEYVSKSRKIEELESVEKYQNR